MTAPILGEKRYLLPPADPFRMHDMDLMAQVRTLSADSPPPDGRGWTVLSSLQDAEGISVSITYARIAFVIEIKEDMELRRG